MDKINELQEIINNSNNIVFFGGAGVSTESGIPDFRSKDGLYQQKYKYNPEYMLSHEFFYYHTKEFYEFYFDKLVNTEVLPNACHKKLKELEDAGKLKAIVTQNIDGLHEMAGSHNVYNVHGTIYKNYCTKCSKEYNLDYMLKFKDKKEIPLCECGGVIKPDVVLYGEALPEDVVEGSIEKISKCDTLIVGGTSLNVYPAAGLINYFRGKNLVVINKEKLNIVNALEINKNIGEVFSKIKIK